MKFETEATAIFVLLHDAIDDPPVLECSADRATPAHLEAITPNRQQKLPCIVAAVH